MMELKPTFSKLGEKEKHIARVFNLQNASVTNIQMRKGETVIEHDSKRDVIIIVRKGSVAFTVEGVETIVTVDNILHISPLEKHSLRATEDTDIVVFQIMP